MPTVATVMPRLLVLGNLVAWSLFLVLRSPIPDSVLHARDLKEARERLEPGVSMEMASGSPYGILASRYLYNWSNWHGGESPWLKALLILNLPAIVATTIPAIAIGFATRGVVPVAARSWLYFALFLALSSFMWLWVGTLVHAAWSQKRRRARDSSKQP